MKKEKDDTIQRRIEKLKELAVTATDSCKEELIDLSLQIHANPELPFKEFKSSKLLAGYLREHEFVVEYPAYGLDTAFKATIGSSGPRIGIMAEYDAVPGVGHGCGHNIIATAAVGAGVALASVIEDMGGQIIVFGTPAEEGGNGKELMAKQGAFNGLDAAMMIHPYVMDMLYYDCGTICLISVEYFGKTAHPATPGKGIDALESMLAGFGAYNVLLKKILLENSEKEGTSGVILQGGVGAHMISDYTTAQVIACGANDKLLKDLVEKIYDCFKAGSSATGSRLEFKYDWENRYRGVFSNRVMCSLFDANIHLLRPGWNPSTPKPLIRRAGTDMGTVSQIVPSIHPFITIMPADAAWHSVESAAASVSEEGHKAMLDSAKAMAMTAIELIRRPDVLGEAKKEFALMQNKSIDTGLRPLTGSIATP
jgi:amidohydrolase